MLRRLLTRLLTIVSACALGLGLAVAPPGEQPAEAAAGSYLQLSSVGYTTPGERTTLHITWVYRGEPVTGTVNLQRMVNGRWEHIRRITVTDGAGLTNIGPHATYTYRLRARPGPSPAATPTADPNGTSNTHVVKVTTSVRLASAPDLVAPPKVPSGEPIPFTIRWKSNGENVSGKVNLQRWTGSSWTHIRQITVTNGQATTSYTATSPTSYYRLRTSSVTSHTNILTRDPYGTSGTVKVVGGGGQTVPSSFTLTGAGWGHGVGMSQYGAYGMALDGYSRVQILRHYFPGASVAFHDTDKAVRVQVLDGAASTEVRPSGGQARIRIGGSIVAVVNSGTIITVSAVSSGLRVEANGRSWTTATPRNRIHIEWAATSYYQPNNSIQVNTSVSGAKGRYRHGRLEFISINGRVNAVNVVNLTDEYMLGVAEMPSSWAPAALQAQVIAARSYALSTMPSSPRTSCDCHLYDDSRSQNYTGWLKENESTWGDRWSAAVHATIRSDGRGDVMEYAGSVAQTFYYSSSGGRTQNSEDVWVSAVPYLRSVDDHWSLHSRNPNDSWTVQISQASMRSAFGLPDVVSLRVTSRSDGDAVLRITATSSTGTTATITGEQLRSRLGLKSTWVTSIR